MDKQKQKRGKKRSKSYYLKSSQQKRQKLNRLEAGMRGFLITCNRDEKQAVRESYNVLNEYADNLYGLEQQEPDSKNMDSDDDCKDSSEDDMEKAMNKEVTVIKESQTKPRRFQNCFTNAKNCIFIRTTLDDPCDLAHKIFTDLSSTKQQKTRFAIRLLPISGTCKAYLEDVKKLAEQILSPHFCTPMGDGKSFAILFRVRNSHGLGRESVLPMLGQLIVDMNPLNWVHLDNPDFVVLVEVICSICCVSVIKDFYKFRKYNFHEVIKDTENKKDKTSKCVEELKKLSESADPKDSVAPLLNETKIDDGNDKPFELMKDSVAPLLNETKTDDGNHKPVELVKDSVAPLLNKTKTDDGNDKPVELVKDSVAPLLNKTKTDEGNDKPV